MHKQLTAVILSHGLYSRQYSFLSLNIQEYALLLTLVVSTGSGSKELSSSPTFGRHLLGQPEDFKREAQRVPKG